jgi:hypothetical protein
VRFRAGCSLAWVLHYFSAFELGRLGRKEMQMERNDDRPTLPPGELDSKAIQFALKRAALEAAKPSERSLFRSLAHAFHALTVPS